MSANTYDPAFTLLCTDLGLLPENLPQPLAELLQAKLDAAARELQDAGIELQGGLDDLDLQVCYAAWLYRGRVKQQGKPLMLQRLLHNRQVSRATRAGSEA